MLARTRSGCGTCAAVLGYGLSRMPAHPVSIVLASRSPRRSELLGQLGITHHCVDANVDESHRAGESAEDYVQRLARAKAEAGLALWRRSNPSSQEPVLAADTIVVIDIGDEEILLGKPKDRQDAISMLSRLSGRAHRVLTAICMTHGERCEQALSQTQVHFRQLTNDEIAAYWNSGEPADKAGSYGIQGKAALFIEQIEGSYSGVMGLPLCETGLLLKRFGIDVM
jgi:septum formation protein